STRRYPLRSPWVAHAFIQPASLPAAPAAVCLPGGSGVLGEGSIEVGHRLQRSLPRQAGQKTSDLFAVPFDDDFLALDGQPVQYPSQIARQLCCSNGPHSGTSTHKI